MTGDAKEKYLTAKELSGALSDMGLTVSPSFVRAMLRRGVPRLGNRARLSVLLIWWEEHPDFTARPRAQRARSEW